MLRIIPMKDEYREISRIYLLPLGYQEGFAPGDDQDGIPKEEFESLIMEYLPVTAEQLKNYAVFDETTQMYGWDILGCGNYTPSQFGTSIPEVTDITENEDLLPLLIYCI